MNCCVFLTGFDNLTTKRLAMAHSVTVVVFVLMIFHTFAYVYIGQVVINCVSSDMKVEELAKGIISV